MITNASIAELQNAMNKTNLEYNNNILFEHCFNKGKRVDFRLRVNKSRDMGAKLGFSGKHTVAACWHVHRDFLKNLFESSPSVKVKTCIAVYDGKDGFEKNYPDTGYKNIGSIMNPIYFKDSCEC